jgi:uncharacterized membrane protein YphA (DoxX/SURF4 family)
MGSEVIFASLFTLFFIVIGSATIYQSVMTVRKQNKDNGLFWFQMTYPPALVFQIVAGVIYLVTGLTVLTGALPVVRGN